MPSITPDLRIAIGRGSAGGGAIGSRGATLTAGSIRSRGIGGSNRSSDLVSCLESCLGSGLGSGRMSSFGSDLTSSFGSMRGSGFDSGRASDLGARAIVSGCD